MYPPHRNLQELKPELHGYEQAALANLCPETVEEAKAIVPSLKRFDHAGPSDQRDAWDAMLDKALEDINAFSKDS